ncbi:tensin [Culex quinquefasciatus]|uniref:Tensin n=1 Tax=Culex quinquefasciatus TaxID=7176 RepID=B0WEZ7_CULQU|nr:tensin [Culex quinquefasciatus]|eukprot:XP_001847281.1 tensin [Culex quinquefasciatus]
MVVVVGVASPVTVRKPTCITCTFKIPVESPARHGFSFSSKNYVPERNSRNGNIQIALDTLATLSPTLIESVCSYSYGSPAFPTGETPLYHSGTTQHRRSQTLSPVRNSNNERNYHTLTTTTRTHSTERPFVAVKRAHENAKMQTIGVSRF